MKKTGTVRRSGPADADEPGSDSDGFSVVSANPASTAIPALPSNSIPPPGKQSSYPPANLNSRALRPNQQTERQTERETNIKKVPELATWTSVNGNGKHGLTAMTRAYEQNRPAHPVELPRKTIRAVPTIDPTIVVEEEKPHRKASQSQLPTESHSPPDSPPPFAFNISDNLATAASEQILVEASAHHLVILASGVRQHSDPAVTQVCTPERDHYSSNPHANNVHVGILAPEAIQQSNSSTPSPAHESRSGSPTSNKLQLQLAGPLSPMLAAGFLTVPAEIHVWSPLLSVSVVAYHLLARLDCPYSKYS